MLWLVAKVICIRLYVHGQRALSDTDSDTSPLGHGGMIGLGASNMGIKCSGRYSLVNVVVSSFFSMSAAPDTDCLAKSGVVCVSFMLSAEVTTGSSSVVSVGCEES